MTAPYETMTVRVSAANHKRLMDLARQRKSSVDEVVNHLLSEDLVRIELSHIQHARWELAAQKRGVTVDEFVRLTVEAGISYDPRTINQIFYRVDGLCQAAGIAPPVPK